MNIRIFPPEEILNTTVTRLPLSKSVSARVLVLGALTPGADMPDAAQLADCDDIKVLQRAVVERQGEVTAHESGTALRFLTAFFAATEGADVTLTGAHRLCERPIAPLVEALRSLGADIQYAGEEGHAPLRIRGRRLQGGEVNLDARASSQFASALAMVGPTMEKGLRINLGGQIPSMPYLRMTLQMMESRGVDAHTEGYAVMVPKGEYLPVQPESEPDWSAASYWYEIAAVTAGWVTIPGLKAQSLQGDSVLQKIGPHFGVVTEFTDEGAELSATPDIFSRMDMDMSDYPDLVPALAVTASLVGLPYDLTGVGNLRLKESDRLEALRKNLLKLGIVAEVGQDSFSWGGERQPIVEMPEIDPCGDHRIAMAFAAVSVFLPSIIILNAEVVGKSYPGFFDDLRDAGFTIVDADAPMPTPPHDE